VKESHGFRKIIVTAKRDIVRESSWSI